MLTEIQQVMELVAEVLGMTPLSAERMTLTHSGNTIYDVALELKHVIVRMRGNDRDTLSKTAHNIRAFVELGLPVPHVLVSDTSKTRYPFSFIILDKIPGNDLLYELSGMTAPQRTRLAEQIVAVQRAAATLPQGTGFGWGHVGEGGEAEGWFEFLCAEAHYAPPTSVPTRLDAIRLRIHEQRLRFHPYFDRMTPTCFLEDLTTKNILLQEGELQGVIDFDCVCFGDPLWMIGLAAGCILNDIGSQELFYIEELIRCWELTEEQQAVVALYSAQRASEFLADALEEHDVTRVERLILYIEVWLKRVCSFVGTPLPIDS